MPEYTSDEMMTVAAARLVRNGATCFVGIGLPSAAANLARFTHAPDVVLIYESGNYSARNPTVLPLFARLAMANWRRKPPMPWCRSSKFFSYWLQGGRISSRLPGRGADRRKYANLNTTVIGNYDKPVTRMPGAGGAPDIAASAGEVLITLRHGKRAFVEKLDFLTSVGHLEGGDSRDKLRMPGKGPTAVITDLGILTPDPLTKELVLTSVHPGVEVSQVVAATGWPLKVAAKVTVTEPPTGQELKILRDLQERTARAHAGQA